jgi:putative ABC transport system permease protein
VRPFDLAAFALSGLAQQKVRTALTMLGVIIGTFVLVMSISIGRGVLDKVMADFRRYDQLRKVHVHPSYKRDASDIPADKLRVEGAMSDAKRERLREAIVRRWQRKNVRGPRVPLTPEMVKALAAIEHVESAVPMLYLGGRAYFGSKTEDMTAAALPGDNQELRRRLVAGAPFADAEDRGIVVGEYLLYLLGVADDTAVEQVLGQKLRLEFHSGRRVPDLLLPLLNATGVRVTPEEERLLEKAAKQLPAVLDKLDLSADEREALHKVLRRPPSRPDRSAPVTVGEEFTIRGILRGPTKDEEDNAWVGGLERLSLDADVLLPPQSAEGLFLRMPAHREQGFSQVTLTVDSEDHVKGVTERVKAMGLEFYSLVEFVDQVRTNTLLVSFATAFVAAVALIVAALGIANTMLMSVLERTHQIGVMKAVGAKDSHIQWIFLVEGGLLGLAGGALGLLCSWLASFPGDAVARSLVEKHTQTKLEESLFVFPPWLTLGVLAFAVALTTLAAVYPARRAAKVNPITALRHE